VCETISCVTFEELTDLRQSSPFEAINHQQLNFVLKEHGLGPSQCSVKERTDFSTKILSNLKMLVAEKMSFLSTVWPSFSTVNY
jgi:hypothetical protein